MSRYIDADILSDALRRLTLGETDAARATMKITHYVSRMPTADVVEVVRCKDCKHRHDSLLNGSPFEDFCDVFPAYIGKDDYCSYGERADE